MRKNSRVPRQAPGISSTTSAPPVCGTGNPRPGRWRRILIRLSDERGLSATEYAVAAGLISATLAGTLQVLGIAIDGLIVDLLAFM